MNVHILIGPSGSGKSTWVAERPKMFSVGANQFFTAPDGQYIWDQSKLDQAHGDCMRKFIALATAPLAGVHDLAVDNVNTQLWELAPYATIARAYGHEVVLHAFNSGRPESFASRSAHAVPLSTVTRQWHQMLLTIENGLDLSWDEITFALSGQDRSGPGALFPRRFRPFNLPLYFH